ncbi:MAG: hypothetical protein ACI9JM_002311 [Halioglobus sp.]|jgi:uncharacterized protein YcfJ
MKANILAAALSTVLCAACATANTQHLAIQAPVVSVAPVISTVTEKIPHRSCWDETVRVQQANGRKGAATTVLGAIIGGVAGGAIGRNNRHQPLLAGAGAILGAAVAHDASRNRSTQTRYVTEQRCEVDYELRDKEVVSGYRVGYRYGDTIYYTRTQNHPGDTISLNVAIEPVSY